MKKGTYDYPHACIPKADDSSPSIDESSVSISINICSQEKTLLLKVHCKKTKKIVIKIIPLSRLHKQEQFSSYSPPSESDQNPKPKRTKSKWMRF